MLVPTRYTLYLNKYSIYVGKKGVTYSLLFVSAFISRKSHKCLDDFSQSFIIKLAAKLPHKNLLAKILCNISRCCLLLISMIKTLPETGI